MSDCADFIKAACVPRDGNHVSGSLEEAESLRPSGRDIFTAAILGDDAAVREFVAQIPGSATAKGGPYGWDPLTYLCFSRYLRIDQSLSEAFVRTARALLEAGADPNTGWIEMTGHPGSQPILESAIYGAAGVAHHAGLTRFLLEHGADPNDGETAYHAPEGYDNAVMKVLLESGKLNEKSLTCMLARKADWHDEDGLSLVLEHGAVPGSALHHAILRDNHRRMIALLLDYGADPTLRDTRHGRSGIELAARRGRADVLALFEQRGINTKLDGLEGLIAACAKVDGERAQSLLQQEPQLRHQLVAEGGTLLAEFAGNGNVGGLEALLDLGVDAAALYEKGDGYFGIAKNSTALHVAAWRAWPAAVKLLISRGAPVSALDAAGRTPLALAIKACIDSYWTARRSPESARALLEAGATTEGITLPCGYEEVDELFARKRMVP